jgi:signal transduction histidine kinase/CheY-like chemotaxis protein
MRRLLGDRWVGLTVLVGAAWLVAYAIATAVMRSETAALVLSDVIYIIPVAAATALTIWAARRAEGAQRLFWWLLAVATLSWLAGEVSWSVLELGLHREPFPSVADAFFLGAHAAALPAMLLGFGARSHTGRVLLDTSALAAALGVSGYILLIQPQLEYGPSLATAIGIAYPLLDVAVLMVLVGVVSAGRWSIPLPVVIVALAYAVTALCDAGYTYVSITGSYDPGSWLSLGWQLEAVLFCVAAVAAVRLPQSGERRERAPRDNGLLLGLAGTAAAVVVVALDLADGNVSIPVALLGAFVVVTVVLRLVATSREQLQLVAALEGRSRTLAVQARALEATLNQHEQAERELERSVSMLQATLESTADGILVVDREGRIVGFNRRFVELWRIPQDVVDAGHDEAALGYVLDQLADPEAFIAKVQDLYANPEAESFDTLAFKDSRVVERFSMPQRVAGESVGRVWSFRDVTDRSRLEHELRHAQKMEAVGRLAGGVAHDFNNLLTAILGHADLLLGRLDAVPARQGLEEIRKAAERAGGLTSQLLAFSRKQILQPKVVDLNDVVSGMGGLLGRLLGERIELAITPASVPARVVVDRGQIEQVVANLVINARDAMPSGGRIDVETELVEGEALLRVRDCGTGMDEQTLARAFEPFYTTKPAGSGTGLGLATVHGIVEQSGGRIALESHVGVGTTVEVVLPEATAPGDDEAPDEASAAPVRGQGTVLLVEDETVVRELLRDVFADSAFDVLVAANAEEALALSGSHAGTIDVLLTDVVMPGMSGRELAERLGEQRAGIAVVFMSGYTEDAVVRHGVHESATTFLQKPFTLADVVGVVGALLSERAPQAA